MCIQIRICIARYAICKRSDKEPYLMWYREVLREHEARKNMVKNYEKQLQEHAADAPYHNRLVVNIDRLVKASGVPVVQNQEVQTVPLQLVVEPPAKAARLVQRRATV